jgi:hypothetical protein
MGDTNLALIDPPLANIPFPLSGAFDILSMLELGFDMTAITLQQGSGY